MARPRGLEVLPGYRLRLRLDDGRTVERDLSPLLRADPWFASLGELFGTALLLPDGAVEWANGVDMAPETLLWGDAPAGDRPPDHLRLGPPDSAPGVRPALAPGELLVAR